MVRSTFIRKSNMLMHLPSIALNSSKLNHTDLRSIVRNIKALCYLDYPVLNNVEIIDSDRSRPVQQKNKIQRIAFDRTN